MFDRLKARFPVLSRIAGALLAPGGDMVLPPTQPGEQPITVSVPKGILRSKTVIITIIGILYWIARLFGWELNIDEQDATDAAAKAIDGIATIITLGSAALARIKATNITRG